MKSILMHWLIIILGTFILSISISNPFYKLLIEKRLKLKFFFKIFLRILLFILGLFVIFLGLYLESL
tara:strand:- start:86 stop:286 length:201 start_codon:yes stop_codon:yes gene_type:complete